MPTANITESIVIFDDSDNPSNPQRKHCDWKRSLAALPLGVVHSDRIVVAPGETKDLMVRAGVGVVDSLDGMVPSAKPTLFQFAATGGAPLTGQNWSTLPVLAGISVTITANVDGTATIAGTGLGVTGLPGDLLYLGGGSFNESAPFATSNQGFWVIQSMVAGSYRVKRAGTDEPSPVTETVVTANAKDVQVISGATAPTWLFLRMAGAPEFSGLFQVLYATNSWVLVTARPTWLPFTNLAPSGGALMHGYISYFRVEVDGVCRVETKGPDSVADIWRRVLQPAVAGAIAWTESFEIATSVAVDNNMSPSPLTVNLIVAVQE